MNKDNDSGCVSGDNGAIEWHSDRPRLKLTGHRSAEQVDAVFASSMVDVAYVIDATPDVVLIVADDPTWPTDREDYDWLCSVIRETLTAHGIEGVDLSLVPGAGRASPAEPDVVPDPRWHLG